MRHRFATPHDCVVALFVLDAVEHIGESSGRLDCGDVRDGNQIIRFDRTRGQRTFWERLAASGPSCPASLAGGAGNGIDADALVNAYVSCDARARAAR